MIAAPTRAALRYRRGQAVLLALLSALVVGSVAFAPLYARSLELGLLRGALDRAPVAATAIQLSPSRPAGGAALTPDVARQAFPPELAGLFDGGSELWSGTVRVDSRLGSATPAMYAAREVCAGLTVDTGRCPVTAYEILVSTAEAGFQGWTLGQVLDAREVRPAVRAVPAFAQPVTIVGTYTQVPDPAHWLRIRLDGRAGSSALDPDGTPLLDAFVTAPATFGEQTSDPQGRGWRHAVLSVIFLLDRSTISLDDLAQLRPVISGAADAGLRAQPRLTVRSPIGELADDVLEGQRQVRLIVPLLMAQLALLAVVVLGLVAGSAVEQRRQELALARLRGGSASGAARLVVAELGAAVIAGAPIGLLAALGTDALLRRIWLPQPLPVEMPWLAIAAAIVGAAIGLGAVIAVVRPTVARPVSELLRRVPARRHGHAVALSDALVIGVAAAAVLALATGSVTGPLALATPGLLALAVGLALAHVVTPVAARIGARSARRGNTVASLAAVQVARRPAVRRIVAIVTVATSLAVFATDAALVAAGNRDVRARIETGAVAVLSVGTQDPTLVVRALDLADPDRAAATPVAWVIQAGAGAIQTMAVEPRSFARVADLGRDREAFALRRLDSSVAAPSAGAADALPAYVVGGLPPGTTPGMPFQGAGLDGVAVQFAAIGELPYAPGERSTNTAVVSLPALLARPHGTLAVGRMQVFLADPAAEARVSAALQSVGAPVTAVTRTADLQARYDESASAWGLRLAVGVAGLAVLIAGLVLVLVAATAWRGRARDYAALRVAGIPQEVIRRASLAEQAVVVLLATAVGAGCGIASAAMALPILPLFTTPWTALRPDLTLDGAAVVGTVAIALGVLLVSAAGVAAVLVRRATPDRLQEVQ